MIRRRTSAATSSHDDDDDKLGKNGGKAYQTTTPSKNIVSNGTVLAIAAILILVGFAQHHYRESRNKDPFGLFHKKPAVYNGPKQSLLTPQQDANLEYDHGTRYHLVFSTDCSPFQHWQSYLVYFSALKIHQPGHVTRIASGCDPDQAKAMQAWFDKDIKFMSKRFHLHLTPKFSNVKNEKGETVGNYKFFNKPFGLKYWLENDPLLQFSEGKHPDVIQNDMVILIDPDMGLIQPIRKDFSNLDQIVIGAKKHVIATEVGPGHPFAQTYGFGIQWKRLDLEKIAGAGTPAKDVKDADGIHHYPVGPPYFGTVGDMYRIATKWAEFAPKVYEQYPHLLAEMFAFSIAAAHEQLPFQLIDSLMVSDVGAFGEGWPLVDKIPVEETCSFAKSLGASTNRKYAVPYVVHLCQRYILGQDWFFAKHSVPSDIYDCEVPLFKEPPNNLGLLYDFKEIPFEKREDLTPADVNRHTFVLCFIYTLVNDAATFYKKNACAPDNRNLEKTRSLAKIKEAMVIADRERDARVRAENKRKQEEAKKNEKM